MFNAHAIFQQLGEGLGHDCYLDTVQNYGFGHYFEPTALHLGQNTAHSQSKIE